MSLDFRITDSRNPQFLEELVRRIPEISLDYFSRELPTNATYAPEKYDTDIYTKVSPNRCDLNDCLKKKTNKQNDHRN